MLWLIFALLNPICWSVANIVNKIMVERVFKTPFAYFTMSLFSQVIATILIAIFFVQPVGSFEIIILTIFSSLLSSAAFATFLFALQSDEASKVVPLSYIGNIFIIILAYIFLNEAFTAYKYIGIAMILSGAVLLSYKKSKGKLTMSPSIFFVILSSVFFSTGTILDKIILEQIDSWSRLMWGTIATVFVIIAMMSFKKIRTDVFRVVKTAGKKVNLIIAISAMFGLTGLVSIFIALSLGPATLVTSIGATSPLMVLILTTGISIFFPHILKENIDKRNMIKKVLGTFLIILGAIFIVF
jgi:uncharacterized membrane protein